MNIQTPKDKFIYIHDDYESCHFCADTYHGYSIFEYGIEDEGAVGTYEDLGLVYENLKPILIDITFHDKKMEKLGYVVDSQYGMTYFIAKHPRLLKKDGIPHTLHAYAEYLKENHRQDTHKEKDATEKDYADLIESKIRSMKKTMFRLKDVPQNETYLKECISQSPNKFLFGIKIRQAKIYAAKINKDDSSGVDDYKDLKDLEPHLKTAITSLNPAPSHNILAAYYDQEEFDEGAIRHFLFAGKQLIESTNETVYLKDAEFEALLEKVAYLCHLWKEKKEISNKFFKEANDFILYKRTVPANPVVDFAASFFDSLISNMKANNQLIECEHCHLLAKYFRNKKFCSKLTDGRNCFGKHHSKQDYLRHKTKRLNTKRAWIKKTRKEIPGY